MIKKAAAILRQGGVVAFPTDTVYGLGVRVFDAQAIKRLYEIKGRSFNNPLIVHIAQKEQLSLSVKEVPSAAAPLIKAFWPGPLTLVLKRSDHLPAILSAGLSTVAIRMPNHKMTLELIRELGEPVTGTSANRSGNPGARSAREVKEALGECVDIILDGGDCPLGIPSTLLDLTSHPPRILRPGPITQEEIRSVMQEVVAIDTPPL